MKRSQYLYLGALVLLAPNMSPFLATAGAMVFIALAVWNEYKETK